MCVVNVGIFTNHVHTAGSGTCSMRVRVRLQDIVYTNIIIFVWFGGGVCPLPYYFRARVEAIAYIIIISYTIQYYVRFDKKEKIIIIINRHHPPATAGGLAVPTTNAHKFQKIRRHSKRQTVH